MHQTRLSRPVPGSALLLSAFLAFSLAPAPRLSAQAALNPPAAAITAGTGEDEEIVIMTPFDVVAQSKDDGRYETSRSNAITGTNLPLERVPLTANIFNSAFLEDMGVVDITEMLTKYAGFEAPLDAAPGAGARGAEGGDRTYFHNLSVRGLGAGVQRREGFLFSEGTTLDAFDVESVEQVNGSQSLIYGAGDAGGVVNFIGKRAKFNSRYGKVKLKLDSEGSRRYEAEANYGTRTFAVTAVGVKDDTLFWKPGLEREHKGHYAAIAVRPTNWLILRAEYRKFKRYESNAQSAKIYAPNEMLPYEAQSTTVHHGNKDAFDEYRRIRYLLWSQGDGFMGFDWSNADSPLVGVNARTIDHEYYGVAAEARVTRWFSLQLRWGNDERTNLALMSNSKTSIYHPLYSDSTATAGRDRYYPELKNQWAYEFRPEENFETAGSTFQSQKGIRITGNLRFNTGSFAHHEFNFSYQQLDSRNKRVGMRFYQIDDSGRFVDASGNPLDMGKIGDAAKRVAWGTNAVNQIWVPAFSGGYPVKRWPYDTITVPAFDGTGSTGYSRNAVTYKLAPIRLPGSEEATPENPLGLTGGTYTTDGNVSGAYRILETDEDAIAGVLMSSWWDNHITTMLGYRLERFTVSRANDGRVRGPLNKDTLTAGVVFDIWRDLSGFVSHSTNAKVRNELEQLDLYNNPIPFGEGVSNEAGFKFKLFNRRINGSASAYQTRVKNEALDLGAQRDTLDPNGLNGRHVAFTPYATRDRTSKGFGVSFSAKPMKGWEAYFRYSHADGKIGGNSVVLPRYYNDQFHTITENGETFVARKLENGTLEKVMVPAATADYDSGNPTDPSYTEYLTIGMMKSSESPWQAKIGTNGAISNENNPVYNVLRQAGVGTGVTGLPLTAHQLADYTASQSTYMLSRAGEKTPGYAENSFGMENRFSITRGWFKGLRLGCDVQYRRGIRGYYYYVDMNDNGKGNDDGVDVRTLRWEPNYWNMDASASYEFRFGRRIIWTINLHIINVLGKESYLPLISDDSGSYFSGLIIAARPLYSPRRFVLTNTIKF